VDEAKPRGARLKGFSLHANKAVAAGAREQLEHLCRYLLRPPLAQERLTESSQGLSSRLRYLHRGRHRPATPIELLRALRLSPCSHRCSIPAGAPG